MPGNSRRGLARRVGVILGWSAILAPLVGSYPARAEETRKIAVFVLPADKFSAKAAAVLNYLARENFEREKRYTLVPIRTWLESDVSDKRIKILQQARSLLASGKEEYDNLELDGAITALTHATEKFAEAVGRLGNGDEYVEALLYLAAAHILSGDNEKGAETFRMVAMFDKRRALDTRLFPPSMVEIFNSIKAEVAAAPVGMVQIKSEPAAAEVYLNGVYQGISPVSLAKIPEGKHFVRLEKDGYIPWGKLVAFNASREGTLEVTLQEAPKLKELKAKIKSVLVDMDEDEPQADVIALGKWLQVQDLIVVGVRQRGEEVVAEAVNVTVDPPKRNGYQILEFGLIEPNFPARADAFFTSLYRKVKIPQRQKIEGGTAAVDPTAIRCNSNSDCAIGEVCDAASGRCIPKAPERQQYYEKWWFWAIVGGGLAVVSTIGFWVWSELTPEEGAIVFSF